MEQQIHEVLALVLEVDLVETVTKAVLGEVVQPLRRPLLVSQVPLEAYPNKSPSCEEKHKKMVVPGDEAGWTTSRI